jgi:hypothetical protein
MRWKCAVFAMAWGGHLKKHVKYVMASAQCRCISLASNVHAAREMVKPRFTVPLILSRFLLQSCVKSVADPVGQGVSTNLRN